MVGSILDRILVLVLLALPGVALCAPHTMRLDYFHTGNANMELFSVDRVVVEPLEWPGNPQKAIDDTNLGKYFFEVIDRKSNRTVYSRGFSSVYGEWETTDEAKADNRTFHESLRFPEPTEPVQIVVKKRDKQNAFREVWSTLVDPADMFVDRSTPASPGPLLAIQKSGDPAHKVDLLILGDGYTAAERGKFEKDARRMVDRLFATSPFREQRSNFNVWALCPPAAESGISRPSTGVHKNSPVGTTYDAFGSERYVLTFDNRAFRTAASFAPYDFVEILVNGKTYGGGGIFGQYSTVAADSVWSSYVFIHEFGHHFADLADEYFTSSVAYAPVTERPEPWAPNVTTLRDPQNLKWKDLVSADTPIPTSWDEDAFTTYSREIQKRRADIRRRRRPESEMDALFLEEKQHVSGMLSAERYYGKVGAFEGANYEAQGYYRPELDCIMFTRDDVPFCAVCRRAIARIIALYS
jgi:IgA peptidase M64/peptidase M64-like protein